MKKLLLLSLGLLCLSHVNAQLSRRAWSPLQSANSIKSEAFPASISTPTPGSDRVNALFDIQFDYNLNETVTRAAGLAGSVFFERNFWVTKWASDTIFELDSVGRRLDRFRITGVTGIRSMTYDGTSIYAGRNSPSIAVINPVTRTLSSSITVPQAVGNVRFISYVASADGGNGGFYVGNFNTPIFLISRTGDVLETIDAATHGQTGMYGLAYDTISPGSPYIWVFCQNDNGQNLVRLDGTTGEPTGVSRNVILDFQFNSGPGIDPPLAGGMFIHPGINDTVPTIGGVIQGTPNRLFGYELGDFVLPDIEAEMVSLVPVDEYVMKPRAFNPTVNFTAKVANLGSTVFDTVYVRTGLFDPDSLEITTTTAFARGLRYPDSTDINTGHNLVGPDVGRYTANASLFLWGNNIDPTPINNSKSSEYYVTDSIYSRTYPNWVGSLGIGQGGGVLGNRYRFPQRMLITSITARFNAPTEGDSVFFQITNFAGNNPGPTLLRRTDAYVFTADDETNGIWLTLPLRGGAFNVNANTTVMVSAREHTANLTLATNPTTWRANTSYVRIGPTAPWQTTESAGFRRTFVLFPNVQLPVDIDGKFADIVPQVYPNPSSGEVFIDATGVGTFNLKSIAGQTLISNALKSGKNVIDTKGLSTGLYLYELVVDGQKSTGKLMVD